MVFTSISVRAFIDIAPTGAIFIQSSLKLLLRTGLNWLDILILINMICNEYYKAFYNDSFLILLEKIIHESHRIYLQLLYYAFIILYKICIRIFQCNLADMSLMQPDGKYFHLSQNIIDVAPTGAIFIQSSLK